MPLRLFAVSAIRGQSSTQTRLWLSSMARSDRVRNPSRSCCYSVLRDRSLVFDNPELRTRVLARPNRLRLPAVAEMLRGGAAKAESLPVRRAYSSVG